MVQIPDFSEKSGISLLRMAQPTGMVRLEWGQEFYG